MQAFFCHPSFAASLSALVPGVVVLFKALGCEQ